MPVIALGGFGVFEHHTTRHGVGALQVGVVETLDPKRRTRFHVQVGLQGAQDALGGFVCRSGSWRCRRFFLQQVVLHVFFRQFEQFFLVADFGDGDGESVPELRTTGKRHDDFFGNAVEFFAQLLEWQTPAGFPWSSSRFLVR
jgi:hypothetical protein